MTFAERRARHRALGRRGPLEAVHLRARRRRRVSAQVDPDRVLLLDVNYTNNSKTLAPQGRRGGDEVVAEVDGLAAGLPAVVGGSLV